METEHPLDAASQPTTVPTMPAAIRTPDQRVRVFVSSTLDELAPERTAAREAITQLRLTPVLFESGARPYPPRELYRAYLAHAPQSGQRMLAASLFTVAFAWFGVSSLWHSRRGPKR